MPKLAYLGPEGTFTEEALRILAPEAERLPTCERSAPALDAARARRGRRRRRPAGELTRRRDHHDPRRARRGEPLLITAELLLPVEFSLLVRPGTALADQAASAPTRRAHTQCRNCLARDLPDAVVIDRAVDRRRRRRSPRPARRTTRRSPRRSPASTTAWSSSPPNIADRPDTVTRFVRVEPPGPLPAPTGADRTSLVAFLTDDHPGALLEMLTEFAVRGVNLTRIESRPTGDGIGRYCFSSTSRATSPTPGSARRSRACTGSAPTSASSAATRGPTRSPQIKPRHDRRRLRRGADWLDRHPRRPRA